MKFEVPTKKQRLQAIGPTDQLPETLAKALAPAGDFEPVPKPKRGDWLAEHLEDGQTFTKFITSAPNRPDNFRDKIYLLPLGDFPKVPENMVETLQRYAETCFAMKVQLLPPLSLKEYPIRARFNTHTKKRQILTTDMLDILESKLQADAFCILGITMTDLYPDSSWNFVFGQASLRRRVGVYSFARYDPLFHGKKRTKDYEKIFLERSCRVLAHETAHMFGMRHCIFFRCVVNGSNHLKESDSRPLHFCPVCLRKLHYCVGFDATARYRQLLNFYHRIGFDNEAAWIKGRLEWILGPQAKKSIEK